MMMMMIIIIIIIIIIITITTSDQRTLMQDRITCRAVIEDSLIPFAAYTAAESPCTF